MSNHRIVLLVALVLLTVAVLGVSTPTATPDVPPGVDPGLWQRLSPKLGIAVRVERREGATPQFEGTLMFKDGDKWHPMTLKGEPPGIVPAR
jgi:hypothetical protein